MTRKLGAWNLFLPQGPETLLPCRTSIMLGICWDNGKENGNPGFKVIYRDYVGVILGIYWDSGKENGNYSDFVGV